MIPQVSLKREAGGLPYLGQSGLTSWFAAAQAGYPHMRPKARLARMAFFSVNRRSWRLSSRAATKNMLPCALCAERESLSSRCAPAHLRAVELQNALRF